MNEIVVKVMPVLLAALLLGCSSENNQFKPPPPPEVTTANPVEQQVTLFVERTGQTEAKEFAEIRARVEGFVEEILFDAGQAVRQGEQLYRIEPDTYEVAKLSAEAAVDAANAAVTVAEASLENAQAEVEKNQSDFKREQRLLESNAGSQSDFDAAKAALQSAIAKVSAAKANIEAEKARVARAEASLAQAELDLNFTTVVSPIDGRVSKTGVKRGNFVQNGTSLVTVIGKQTLYANFTVSDRMLLELMRAYPDLEDRPDSPKDWAKFNVYLQRDRGEEWILGRLEYIDQTGIEETTGTFALRAEFDNADGKLIPGLFVVLRMPIRQVEDALLVPERALVRTQAGEFLLVVDEESNVQRRPIVLGQILDGWAVVREGIGADEQFVVEGVQRARPGKPVTPEQITLSTEDSPLLQAPVERQSD